MDGLSRAIDGSGCTSGCNGTVVLATGCTLRNLVTRGVPTTTAGELGPGIVLRSSDAVVTSAGPSENDGCGIRIDRGDRNQLGATGTFDWAPSGPASCPNVLCGAITDGLTTWTG